jgi:uncharacterized membrane protein (UPF0136 family)
VENTARIVMAVYGVLMLIGGVGGYAKAHSQPSLIAGIASALLIAIAFAVSRTQPKLGFGIGAVVAIGLVIVFVRRIQELSAQVPPGSIGMNVALCIFSGGVALYLWNALSQAHS